MQSLSGVHGVRVLRVDLKICEVHSLHHTECAVPTHSTFATPQAGSTSSL